MNKTTVILAIIILLITGSAYGHPQTPRQILSTSTEKLMEKGEAFLRAEMPDSALKYFVSLSATYNPGMNRESRKMCAEGALKAGELYYGSSSYVAAFNSFMRAARMGKENGLDSVLGQAYKNLGNINATFNDNLQATYCYRTGLTYARKARDRQTEFSTLVNLAAISTYEKRLAEAEGYYKEMCESSYDPPKLRYFKYFIRGLINSAKGEWEESLADYDKAYAVAVEGQMDPDYVCGIYSEKAKTYRIWGNREKAIDNYRKCAEYAGKKKVFGMLSESYQALGDLYDSVGDGHMSERYRSVYRQLRDSLIREEEYDRIKGEQFTYEMERSYDDISRLNEEVMDGERRIKRHRDVIIVTSLLLLLFLIMAVGLYAQKNKLQKAYNAIYKKNEELLESDRRNRELKESLDNFNCEGCDIGLDGKPVESDSPADEVEGDGDEEKRQSSADRLTDIKKGEILRKVEYVLNHNEEVYDADFGMDRLAELTGVNTRYLSQVVNESMGGNFRSVLNEYRIREAQRRLSDTARYGGYTIQGIANSVGYKSYPNFVSAFKKQIGITPSIYQKTAMREKKGG